MQRKRGRVESGYRAEVPVSGCFDSPPYRFRVDGRIDGLLPGDPPLIEEIKSTFDLPSLSRSLASDPTLHPYALQLLTYGYLYRMAHGVTPRLAFHLVSSRTGESLDLPLAFDFLRYESWLEQRLGELRTEAERAEKCAARRRKAAATFPFPFEAPRPGQMDLVRAVEEGIARGGRMLIQAPTGMGKTVGVLWPILRDGLLRGRNTVYLTPKNSQQAVAEDAVERFRAVGVSLRSLAITAKGKICLRGEPLCTPDACEFSADYHDKVRQHRLREILVKKRRLKAQTFTKLAEEYRVCPFELQMECVPEADIVICDYNYVFAPRTRILPLTGIEVDSQGKPNLVVDEAHNLPERGMEYYSPAISTTALQGLREELEQLHSPAATAACALVDRMLETLCGCAPPGGRGGTIAPPKEQFCQRDEELQQLVARYLGGDGEIVRGDPLLRLGSLWSEFSEMLCRAADPAEEGFFVTWQPEPAGCRVKITCCDPAPLLRECYRDYGNVVLFSATLKPFDYYAALSGLDPSRAKTAEFPSPFPRERRKILVIPQVSTCYSRREHNYGRIADAVRRIASLRKGNYCAFFPSFEFLERTAAVFEPPEGMSLLKQEPAMKTGDVERVLDLLRTGEEPAIVFAVQGGSFAEGIDYAGEALIGAFVIGPPLPRYDLEREEIRKYCQRRYGAGFDYAYAIPAMARAVQAAGRVIRSESDSGLIVLMDRRFTDPVYTRCMPRDWFETEVSELVSEGILADVAAFWFRVDMPAGDDAAPDGSPLR